VHVTRGPRPTQLASYQVERLLGRGGMGEVYLAEDLRLKRKVALKVLSAPFVANEAFRERFLTESELAASIDHPNIVPIYEAGEANGYLFIAMRYVEGTDLRARLRDGPLSPAQAIDLLSQVASALDLAHARGLVHRDVKPSNVLVAPGAGREGVDHAYLADFGLTKRLSEGGSLSEDGQLMGTVDYVAPEQITGGEIDGRADVYSLGCLLFECLAGDPPFRRDSDIAVLFAHLEEPPPRLSERQPDLPEAIDPVIAKALEKDPAARYQACHELVRDTREAFGVAEPRRRRIGRSVLGGVVAAALLVVWLGSILLAGTPTDTLVRIDPASNEVVESIEVGDRASSVAVGDGFVWVTSLADRSLWRVDPQTGATRATPVEGSPLDVVVRNGLAVVTSGTLEGAVHRIDAASGALIETIPLSGAEGALTAVASGADGIWVMGCGYGGGNVGRVSEARSVGGITAIDRVGLFSENPNWVFGHTSDFPAYTDIAVGEGAVWVTLDSGPALRRIDPKGRRPIEVIGLPVLPKSVAVGAGSVWVTALVEDVVVGLDPRSGVVTKTVPVGRGADGVAVGLGNVWVASSIAGTVTRIDPETGEILATIDVDGRPEDLVVGAGGVWVTTHTS
jgi:streptogramin lyase/tRNA A-37 threonylcarbamoyl transferase component Bud32